MLEWIDCRFGWVVVADSFLCLVPIWRIAGLCDPPGCSPAQCPLKCIDLLQQRHQGVLRDEQLYCGIRFRVPERTLSDASDEVVSGAQKLMPQ